MKTARPILKFSLLHLLIIIAIYTILYAAQAVEIANSYFSGGLVILLNAWLLTLGWRLIFSKKSVGLSVFLIVFKYAILAVIIYFISKENWVDMFSFSMGLITITISALGYALVFRSRRK